MSEKNLFALPTANEINLEGVVIATQSEDRHWNDKQTGLPKSMTVVSVILQGAFGVVFVSCFAPSFSASDLKSGSKVFLPIDKFEKQNGMKVATLVRGR